MAKSKAQWIQTLKQPNSIAEQSPCALRFLYALRLIAVHEKARRDPVPELAARLGHVAIAAKVLSVAQTITAVWPENIHVSRYCCGFLTHDEHTIGTLMTCAMDRQRERFEQTASGLVRQDRIPRLWSDMVELAATEAAFS